MSDAVNLRIDPRTGEKNWTDPISEELTVAEFDELPGVFGVLLTQVPHPTSIEVYLSTDPSVPLTRITAVTEPEADQFWSDSQQLKPRGYVILNSSLDGQDVIIIYRGGGYLAHKRVLETVIPEGPPGPPGGVDTVFGRSGDVVAASGDYDLSEIDETGTYKRYTATEQTKLAGIATGADATNTAINSTNKATFADDDRLAGANSASGNSTVYWLWSLVKSSLATFLGAQLCKAWCNFDGTLTGTNAPRAGHNVSSVTRNSTGDYTITFTSAMADANYSIVAMCRDGSYTVALKDGTTPGTGSFTIVVTLPSVSTADKAYIFLQVFGN